MAYSPRLSAPGKDNKYYYANNVFYKSGYGLPNCTCYAWGRFYEISGSYPKLSTSNAENWYGHSDGYSRGKTPKLGAVICWSKGAVGNGSDGAGHVAIVEEIYSDGSILIGQSGWNASKTFWTSKISKGYALSGYNFQGFIYNPAVSDSSSSSSSSSQSVKFQCTVTANSGLNVRSGPGTNYSKSGGLSKGTKCDIVATSSDGKWGQLTSGGWINLSYTSYTSTSSSFKCVVTANSGLNVRSGPGTGYKRTGGLNKGTTCNVVATSSDGKWGQLSGGGWINLSYVSKIIMTCKVTANSGLNVRSGPGTNYKRTTILKKGTTCNITEKSSDGKWGKLTSGGWINLSYVS